MHRASAGAAAAALLFAVAAAGDPLPGPRHPLPATRVRPLPTLEASDGMVRDAVSRLHGAEGFAPLLASDHVIARFVAWIEVVASGAREGCAPACAAIGAIDAQGAARLYARLYPLLQQAYERQRPARGYFNDRVVEAIDRLLAEQPPPATRENLERVREIVASRAPG